MFGIIIIKLLLLYFLQHFYPCYFQKNAKKYRKCVDNIIQVCDNGIIAKGKKAKR